MSPKRTSYVAPPLFWRGGGLKTQKDRFPSKIAFRLKKVCYKDSMCENCQSYKAFGVTNYTRAKMIDVGRPLKSKFCIK